MLFTQKLMLQYLSVQNSICFNVNTSEDNIISMPRCVYLFFVAFTSTLSHHFLALVSSRFHQFSVMFMSDRSSKRMTKIHYIFLRIRETRAIATKDVIFTASLTFNSNVRVLLVSKM